MENKNKENKEWQTTLTQGQIIAAIRSYIHTSQLVVVKDVKLGMDEREKFYAEIKGIEIPDAQSPDIPRKETYTGHSTGV